MAKTQKIKVQHAEIRIFHHNEEDYISLTDMLKQKDDGVLISKWLSNKNTIEFLGVWEKLYHTNFNYTEFGIIRFKDGQTKIDIRLEEISTVKDYLPVQTEDKRDVQHD